MISGGGVMCSRVSTAVEMCFDSRKKKSMHACAIHTWNQRIVSITSHWRATLIAVRCGGVREKERERER